MTEPTTVRCPAIAHPERGLADPAEFDALLRRLAGPGAAAGAVEVFPRGTMQLDGRLDLCKQGVMAVMRPSAPAARGPISCVPRPTPCWRATSSRR
ncbi:MAG: hypothetical protein JWP76_549 [Dactylosporangium sp.]|nr:hypothetical protein [Dactylosporangium sp.]